MLLAGQDLHALLGFRPLLYPLFLAAWYKLGGGWGVELALLAQHLLGMATGVLVALLGARLFRHRLCGVAAGALFLLAPVPLYFEGELLIEPSYVFLICAGLLLHLRAAEMAGWKGALMWAACGGVIILASQARANILVFMAVYPAFAVWRAWRVRRWASALPLLGLAGGLAMAVPWGVLNMRQSDHFHLVPNAGGVNLYLGNKRIADGMVPRQERYTSYGDRYQDSVETWARQEYEAAMRAQGRVPDTDPMAISKFWTRRTIDEIRSAPAAWVHLLAKKCWLTLWNAEIPNNKAFAFLQQEFLWLRWLPVRWVVLLMLAPAGLWAALKWGNRDALFILLLYAGLYCAGNIAFFICDRYRYPVWPVLAVVAGGGLLLGVEAVRRRRWLRATAIAGAMAFMAALSLPNWFGAELPSFARDYYFRSLAWYDKGHFREALDDANRSVELDPGDAVALHHLGNVQFALGRLQQARETYVKMLQITPEESRGWNNLGEALDGLGQPVEALKAFRRAADCVPPSKSSFRGAAVICIRQGRLEEAAVWLDGFDKLQAGPDAPALALRSALERRRGNASQADVLEQQARALDPAGAAWGLERVSGIQ
jgi:tetratricopeptide (TPR) repeat protein